MSKKTINNLISKEKQNFLANVQKYQKIINCSKVVENGGASTRTDCGQATSNVFYTISNLNGVPLQSSSKNKDVSNLLGTVIENQNKMLANQDVIKHNLQTIENRLAMLETTSTDFMNLRSEAMAHSTQVRECNVLIKRMHKTMCRMTGETEDATAIEIESSLPISTTSACIEMEEKLQKLEYEKSMKAHISKLKCYSGSLDDVLRSLFTDEFCSHYNFDGKFGKLSLMELNLMSKTLFDVFQNEGRQDFHRGVKRYIDLSHNRHRQRQHYNAKKPKINTNN